MDKCLIDVLKTLKDSSKEAVEGTEKFDSKKIYMHIHRKVEEELREVILKASQSTKKKLVLVCGSVGDGKSHLISYLNNKEKILDDFTIHNDATESLTPDMTSIETLDQVLKSFRDENLEDGTEEKVVVAINLGMLNNFLDSEIGSRYQALKAYVDVCGILESYTSEYAYDEDSFFQHINFSDYHLYQLTKSGDHIDSSYIKEIISKITAENEKNYFYNAYSQSCLRCQASSSCPVKQNYEVLRVEQVQDALIDVLVEAMLKNKMIVSTRTLLSFIYDIIVSSTFNKERYLILGADEKLKVYLESLLPNLLYGHKGKTEFLDRISKDDPMGARTESVDEIVIKFNTLDHVIELMESCLNQNIYLEYLKEVEINRYVRGRSPENIERRNLLLNYFIRAYRLLGIEGKLDILDHTYVAYVDNLYAFNAGDVRFLRDLYTNLKEAIFMWNGYADNQRVNVSIGENQFKYKFSQQLELKEKISNNIKLNNEEILDKFIPYITVGIANERGTYEEWIDIDYSLFKLISDIKQGYRPNVKDKNQFISFVNTIERIYNHSGQSNELIIERKNASRPEKFLLKHDAFGFKFERIG